MKNHGVIGKLRRTVLLSFAGLILFMVIGVSAPVMAQPVINSVYTNTAPTIDGVMSAGEWGGVTPVLFTTDSAVSGELYVMHDNNNIYLAVKTPDDELTDVDDPCPAGGPYPGGTGCPDYMHFYFDNDNSGSSMPEAGDDIVGWGYRPDLPGLTGFDDAHSNGTWAIISDEDEGGTNDGQAAVTNDGSFNYYEVSHPLDTADNNNDFSLNIADTVGLIIRPNVDGWDGGEWPSGPTSTQWAEVVLGLSSSPVAYYPFNGNANDASGNGNNGTVSGASLTGDKNGIPNSAYSFDGSDDYIEILNSPTLSLSNFQNGYTIAAWIKPTALLTTPNSQSIVSKEDGNFDLKVRTYADVALVSYVRAYHRVEEILSYAYNNTLVYLYNDIWYHAAVTWDGPGRDWIIYVNGIPRSHGDEFGIYPAGLYQASDDGPMRIGMNQQDPAQAFNGTIDEVYVYNRALSQLEIQQLIGLPSDPCAGQGGDADEDGICQSIDNCPDDSNSGQGDADGDSVGDACDNCPDDFNDAQADNDNDGIGNVCDICPTIWDVDQVDTDDDLVGDLCDNCPNEPNSDQTDSDGDAIPGVGGGDACETPGDIDEILFSAEPKNKQDAAEENFSADTDSDGIFDDGDGSGVVGDNTCQGGSTDSCDDNCLKLANGPNAAIPEAGNQLDTDSDGVGNACDNCELVSNPDQVDLDGDGYGDDCDNCKTKFNPDQADFDGDEIGDLCDDDKDNDTYTFANGDCNDFDASINPGSADLLKDCNPDNDPGLVITMTGGGYSTYLPEIGASVELTLRYNDANGDEQTLLPSSWTDFVWSFDDVSSYPGRFGNGDPTDLGPDFVLTPTVDPKKVLLESNDSGGRAVVQLAVSDASGALQASATKTFPLDWDGDLLPYAWEVLYGDIPGAGADQEVLGIVNPNAVGTLSIGDKFTAHYEYRGVDVNADGSITPDERFSPIMKDLILTLEGYESTPIGPIDFKPFFDAPNCFREAGIDVHLVNKPDFKENGVEVLVVEHHPDETLIGTDGNKNHDGIDFWTYDPRGRSGVGDINDYGDKRGIEYTRTFDFPWWNFHTQSPYINYTMAQGGVSDGFDPYPQREDANDDCVIGGREDDKSPRGPNTDVCVKDSNIPGGYDWEAGINPNTADDADHPLNIILGGVESAPIHTLWSVLIHEATHSLGVGPHCDDDTCIMHKVKINHAINHICDYCRAKIQIHKE